MIHRHFPLLLPLLIFIFGIIVTDFFLISNLLLASGFVFCFGMTLFVKKNYATILFTYSIFFIGGAMINATTESFQKESHFDSGSYTDLHIKITHKKPSPKGFTYEAKVIKGFFENSSNFTTGKLILYTKQDVDLALYNVYSVPSNYSTIEKYRNPGLFDYGTYLSQKRIYHRSYLANLPDLISSPRNIYSYSRRVRVQIESFFADSFEHEKASSLINAIFLGNKGSMSTHDRDLFTNNGLAHLLAISGMHVGIIYIIINFLLRWIPIAWLRKSIILVGVWFYIILSGLQIPAIRAGFMLSVFILGQLSDRNVKSLNSIFFAALIMLAIEPKLIYQVSFQLSFSAMCSILLFYKPIFDFISFEKKWQSGLWQLCALNISVQIFVLPLSIYYFQQLPTYFFFTSLISIPFVAMIMWGTLVCLLSSYVVGLGQFFIDLLENLIVFYLSILEAFSKLPNSLIEHLDLSIMQLLSWIVASLLLYTTIVKKKKSLALHCMAFLPFIAVSSTTEIIRSESRELIIYDDAREIIIDFKAAGETIRFQQDTSYQAYFLKDRNADSLIQIRESEIYTVAETTFGVFKEIPQEVASSVIDICILPEGNSEMFSDQFCKQIIIPRKSSDGSEKLATYNILHQGAYSIKL